MNTEKKKSPAFEIKTSGDSGTFSGKASVYGVVDSYNDIVMPGAFRSSLAKRGGKVPVLYQHDAVEPIGVGELVDSDGALLIKGKLLLDLPIAQKAYTLAKEGLLALSIGYFTGKARYDSEGHRLLEEVDVMEVSFVTFPANPAATIDSVRSRSRRDHSMKELIAEGLRTGQIAERDAKSLLGTLRDINTTFSSLKRRGLVSRNRQWEFFKP